MPEITWTVSEDRTIVVTDGVRTKTLIPVEGKKVLDMGGGSRWITVDQRTGKEVNCASRK